MPLLNLKTLPSSRMQQIHDAPAVTIRQPATANLMLDSIDRPRPTYPLANDFQINKPQALLNGFFNRVGTTEITLEWLTPNIAAAYGNNTITIDLSGSTSGTVTQTVTFVDGFYNQAQALNVLKYWLNALGAGVTPAANNWTIAANPNGGQGVGITANVNVYVKLTGPLAAILLGAEMTAFQLISNATPLLSPPSDLRAIRYLDFVSSQLTYNQDLKDSATAPIVRDVLARWYMAYDNYTAVDEYGFPILMGYESFTLRRTFSPPKQIRWDNIQPVGNLAFQVYNDLNEAGLLPGLAYMTDTTNWLMTLQVSEN